MATLTGTDVLICSTMAPLRPPITMWGRCPCMRCMCSCIMTLKNTAAASAISAASEPAGISPKRCLTWNGKLPGMAPEEGGLSLLLHLRRLLCWLLRMTQFRPLRGRRCT